MTTDLLFFFNETKRFTFECELKEKNWKSNDIGLYLAPGPLHHLTSSVQNA